MNFTFSYLYVEVTCLKYWYKNELVLSINILIKPSPTDLY